MKKSKLKEYQDEKKMIEDEIIRYIQDNKKSNLQINTSDGFIDFHETKAPQIITIRYVKEALAIFFKQKPDLKGVLDADTLVEFLLEHREIKTKMTMRRHISS